MVIRMFTLALARPAFLLALYQTKGGRVKTGIFLEHLWLIKLENPNVYIAQELEGIENIRLLILPGN